MDARIEQVMRECTLRSDDSSMSFPDVVKELHEAGVERYHSDLRRAERTYYMPNGESLVTATHPVDGATAQEFNSAGVEAAVRAVQAGKIDYAEFCRHIVAAGCVDYVVSLAGRRVIYSGRAGDCHVEHFPPQP